MIVLLNMSGPHPGTRKARRILAATLQSREYRRAKYGYSQMLSIVGNDTRRGRHLPPVRRHRAPSAIQEW